MSVEPIASIHSIRPRYFHLAIAASRSGHYEEALMAARERDALDPTGWMGLFLAGNVHHASGRFDKALKTYYYGFRLAPNEAPIRFRGSLLRCRI